MGGDAVADEIHAVIVEHVFQPGALSVAAVAVIALEADHRLGRGQ